MDESISPKLEGKENQAFLARLTKWLRERKRILDAFLFGAAMSWVMPPYMNLRRGEMERLFVLTTSSRLMGVPVLPQIYSLKLLPHLVPVLLSWRRSTIFDHAMEGADLKHLGH